MILWQNLDMSERIAAAQTTAANKNIEDRAVEKDWWVTAVLKALFSTSCSNYLLFKGGTSISKGWPIIERFSEDIDLSLGRQFFLDVMKLPYAAAGNNTQLKNLRKASRKYIHGTLSKELCERLSAMGIVGFTVENQTTQPTAECPKPIDADSDPTIIFVNYDLDYPAAIKFVPEGETLDAYRRDYNDNMVNGYIYGEAMAFDALMERIKLLQQRFRNIEF